MFSDNFVTENHEAELADEEAQGRRPLSEKRCSKNPGHPQFIPIKCFQETHLPPELRDRGGTTYNKILCQAKLTVKIRGGFISKDRPEGFPLCDKKGLSVLINGTGFIYDVSNSKEPDEDKKIWVDSFGEPSEGTWLVKIVTAAHVVFDQTEVEACQKILDFDDEAAEREGRVVTLKGETLIHRIAKEDSCEFYCSTQDRDLGRKLWQILSGFYFGFTGRGIARLINKSDVLYPNYSNLLSLRKRPTVLPQSLCRVMVSHPHGHSKMVTIGTCVTEPHIMFSGCFIYDTPTCPGSSGALVMCDGDGEILDYFIHYGKSGSYTSLLALLVGRTLKSYKSCLICAHLLAKAYWLSRSGKPLSSCPSPYCHVLIVCSLQKLLQCGVQSCVCQDWEGEVRSWSFEHLNRRCSDVSRQAQRCRSRPTFIKPAYIDTVPILDRPEPEQDIGPDAESLHEQEQKWADLALPTLKLGRSKHNCTFTYRVRTCLSIKKT
ncbi:anaphase-promoting complex subunit 13 [Plakobranchus ocellatus]|uniref:Anaphase-promoting complex subunit 13 n=1 Tax=Plakobranchus ocellatus TaxID=259542 RepID=A0AAV4DTZ2_9GAST|nr:anaphase-promoting complex subunit 13 [Plakobranchus ocellatus]